MDRIQKISKKMNSTHRFILDPTRGSCKKTTCPECGKKRCFKHYVDSTTGDILHETCGRCDHEQSCGYHLTPSMLFQSMPDLQNRFMKGKHETFVPIYRRKETGKLQEKKTPPPLFLDMKMVTSHQNPDNHFVPWLYSTIRNENMVNDVLDEYMVGSASHEAYRDRPVIFWYIDKYGNVRDGKMMWYKDDGHRQQWVNWVSSKLIKAKMLPEGTITTKCLFGEHLIDKYPDKPIAIVESEKSALFCACLYPKYIWLSTGGCGGLNEDRLKALTGRRVILFPDSGKLKEWRDKMYRIKDMQYSFMEDMERFPPNTDIVDVLLQSNRFRK